MKKAPSSPYRTDLPSDGVSTSQPGAVQQLNKPSINDRIMNEIQKRVYEILEENPITRTVRRIWHTIATVKKSAYEILGWKPEMKAESPSPQVSEGSNPSPPPSSQPVVKNEPESPFKKGEEEYQKLLKDKEQLIADDMAVISAHISHEINGKEKIFNRNEQKDDFAQERVKELQKTPLDASGGIQHCTTEKLREKGCVAENILRVPMKDYPNAAKIMEAFMNSFEHRKNLKGNFEEYGIAMKYHEEQEMIYAVIVYAKGKPAQAKSEHDLPITPLPPGFPDSSSQIDLLSPYREALKEESANHADIFVDSSDEKGLVLKHQKTGFVQQYIFSDCPLPPHLVRYNLDRKPEIVAINKCFEDFEKMEALKKDFPSAKTPAPNKKPDASTLEEEMASLH